MYQKENQKRDIMNDMEALRQETEQLKNAIRVRKQNILTENHSPFSGTNFYFSFMVSHYVQMTCSGSGLNLLTEVVLFS